MHQARAQGKVSLGNELPRSQELSKQLLPGGLCLPSPARAGTGVREPVTAGLAPPWALGVAPLPWELQGTQDRPAVTSRCTEGSLTAGVPELTAGTGQDTQYGGLAAGLWVPHGAHTRGLCDLQCWLDATMHGTAVLTGDQACRPR